MAKSKEELSEYNKNYYRKNKYNILLQRQIYRIDNQEKLKEYCRNRYVKNREKIISAAKKYYKANKQAAKQRSALRCKRVRIKESNEKWLLRGKEIIYTPKYAGTPELIERI